MLRGVFFISRACEFPEIKALRTLPKRDARTTKGRSKLVDMGCAGLRKSVKSQEMKVVGLVSGGKDSCFNMMQCLQYVLPRNRFLMIKASYMQ